MTPLSSMFPRVSRVAGLIVALVAVHSAGAAVLDLRITELMYNPPGGDAYEFLELANTGESEVDLSGATFSGITFQFPPSSLLAPGKVIVLVSDANPGAFAQRYPGVQPYGVYSARLSNGGERISVKDSKGATLTSVEYGDSGFWPKSADGGGDSLELLSAAVEPNDPSAWRASAARLGSPGAWTPSQRSSSVRISEFMVFNQGSVPHGGGFPDWVEFANTTPEVVSLAGWSFTDTSNDTKRYQFPSTATIPGNGRIVLWLGQPPTSMGLNASFGLDRSQGTVALFDPQGRPADVASHGRLPADHTLAWIDGKWQLGQPTPELPNAAAATLSAQNLRINEWYADSLPGEGDWLELFYTHGEGIVDLRGLVLGTDSALFVMRAPNFMAPGEFLRLWADENPGGNHLDFKLPAQGARITLAAPGGELLDAVSYNQQSEGISEGRLPDGSGTFAFFPQGATPGGPNDADRDQDGMPDFWELLHQFDPGDPSDATLDADGDGLSNLSEFLAGTLPRDGTSALRLEIGRLGQAVVLSFEGKPGKSYSILRTDRLGAGTWRAGVDFEPTTTIATREWMAGQAAEMGEFYQVATPKHRAMAHAIEPSGPMPGEVVTNFSRTIQATFAASLNPTSVTSESFRITDDLGRILPGTFRFEENFQSVRFVPLVPLLASTTYHVALDGSLRTANGVPLNWTTNYSFSTDTSAPLTDNLALYPEVRTEVATGNITTFELPGGHTWDDLMRDDHPDDDFDPKIEVAFQEGVFGQANPTISTGVLRVRGQSTRLTTQKSLKLELFDRAGLWRGQRELNLNKHPYDLSRIRNKLAFDLLAEIPDVTSLRTLFIGLNLNGKSLGLFTHVENPDKRFLASHGLDANGHLYKAKNFEFYQYPDVLRLRGDPAYDEKAFEQIMEIKGSRDHAKLIAMLADLNNKEIPFETVMAKHFNRANALTWFATTILLGNLDTRTQNYYLYSPSDSSTWYFLPWDYDGGLDFYGIPVEVENHKNRHVLRGIGNWWGSFFHRRFISTPAFMTELLQKVELLYQDRMTPEKMSALIEPMREVVRPWIASAPDKFYLPVVNYEESLSEWEVELDRLKTRPHSYLTNLVEVVNRPMPIFLGVPDLRGDGWFFAWDKSYDLQGDPFHYDFELSRVPTFAPNEFVVRRTGLAGTNTTVPKEMVPAGTYFWRVVVRQISDPERHWEIPFDIYWDAVAGKAYYGLKKWVVE